MIRNPKVNILLVEDDRAGVVNTKRAFESGGITSPLYVASSGCEALTMLRGEPGQLSLFPPNRQLVLLDLSTPLVQGLEFLRQLRADLSIKHIPVIVITTSTEEKYLTESYNLNVCGYIKKPAIYDEFVELLVTLNAYWSSCEMN